MLMGWLKALLRKFFIKRLLLVRYFPVLALEVDSRQETVLLAFMRDFFGVVDGVSEIPGKLAWSSPRALRRACRLARDAYEACWEGGDLGVYAEDNVEFWS